MSDTVEGFQLSPQQRRLWEISRGKTCAFKAYCTVEIDGSLQYEAWRQALTSVVGRHEILFTDFRSLPGMQFPLQVIAAPIAATLEVQDFSNLAPKDQRRQIAKLEEALPASDSPLATALVRLQANKHVLLLELPAMYADAVSLHNLVRELASAYKDQLKRVETTAEPTVQYADLAETYNRMVEAQEAASEVVYWRGVLSAGELRAPLSLQRCPQQEKNFNPAKVTAFLPGDLVNGAEQTASTNGAALSDLLQSCWRVLLWHLVSRRRVMIGCIFDGRSYEGLGGAVGLLARYLPMTTDIRADQRFCDLLRQVRQEVAEAEPRQDFFDWKVSTDADDGGSSFFQYCFEAHLHPSRLHVENLEFNVDRLDSYFDRFEICLRCLSRQDGLQVEVHYDTSRYPVHVAECLLEQFITLVRHVIKSPRSRIDEVPLLGDSERARRSEWNATGTVLPHQQNTCSLFVAQAARTPNRIALSYPGGSWSYADLDRRTDSIAQTLVTLGVEVEERVAVCLARRQEIPVAFLAVLKAGGAFLPLDPSAPRERLASILDEAAVRIVLTDSTTSGKLPACDHMVLLDRVLETGIEDQPQSLGRRFHPRQLAYVLYTSGSTGRPQGVMVDDRNLVNHLLWVNEHLSDGAESLPFVTPPIFDACLKQVLAPLLRGGCIRILGPEALEDPLRLLAALEREKCFAFNCVPSFWRTVVDALELHPTASVKKSGIRTLYLGGEPFGEELVRRSVAVLPGLELWNLYGPTEATVNAMAGRVREFVHLGRPVSNAKIHLSDGGLHIVGTGVTGQIRIGGAGVARGYLGRPAQTARRFIPDPWSERPGSRLYETGDLARFQTDGVLEFLGRSDQQVKLGGIRIELEEIEAVLRKHQSVADCAAALHRRAGDLGLVMYVVVGSGSDMPPAEAQRQWTRFLSDQLPAPMVPAHFVLLDQLPRLANGKIDRRALPASYEHPVCAEDQSRIRGHVQEILAGIWKDLLDVAQVSERRSFFELGGNSLSAMRLISRVRWAFEVDLPLSAVFDAPKLGAMADQIETLISSDKSRIRPSVETARRDRPLPLSFAQQRLWFLYQLDPTTGAYNIPVAVRLRGHLRLGALFAAWRQIVRRHEILRTTIGATGEEPVQVVHAAGEAPIPVVDFMALEKVFQDRLIEKVLRREARRPFALERGPLWTVMVMCLAEDFNILFINFHHIIYDGWSRDVLLEELTALYTAFCKGVSFRLPALPVQYADYALWQRRWLRGEILERQETYWKRRLAGGPTALALPFDRPRPAVWSYRGSSRQLRMNRRLCDRLEALSQDLGASLLMTLLAAFKTLLWRYSGQTRVRVATPVAGRSGVEVESLIGLFANTVVLQTDLGEAVEFSTLVERVRAAILEAHAHQDFPFELLVGLLEPERDLSRMPLAQASFALFDPPPAHLELPELSTEAFGVESATAKFDLSLEFSNRGRAGRLEYNPDLFDRVTVDRMGKHLQNLLLAAAAQPECRLRELQMLSAPERHQLLISWGGLARATAPAAATLDELFAAQAARTPSAIALAAEGFCLTYGELNRRANRLAHFLIDQGIEPETRIGLSFPPCLEMVVATLGVLKAGAAFVPFDPATPAKRLARLLRDAEPVLSLAAEKGDNECLRHLKDLGHRVIDVDAGRGLSKNGVNPPRRADSQNLAYVIYTSGSTGRPNGVGISHGNVTRLFTALRSQIHFGSEDVWSLFHAYTFDFSVWETWGALLHGGRLVLVSSETRRDPEAFCALLESERITVLSQTPSAFRQLIRIEEHAQTKRLSDVRCVIFGGEKLDPGSLAQWFGNCRSRVPRLFNLYGITETTVHVTCRSVSKSDIEGGQRSPIGRPLADLGIAVLDAYLHPVAAGTPGEICVGGPGLSRGYLRRPRLTATRFVPDPFSGELGQRLYRSGDRARHLLGGDLEYLGRIDHQVKLRGFRIEPGEIETALRSHDGVEECVVMVHKGDAGRDLLVSYLVARSPQPPSVESLRSVLLQRLPEYMVPAAFLFLESLPLTPHGKVNRQALPEPDRRQRHLEIPYVPPRDSIEELLVAIWQQVLDVTKVGIEDNYFALGGDSMLSLRMLALARDRGLSLSLQDLFQHQTISGLAQTQREARAETGGEQSLAAFDLVKPEDRSVLPPGLDDAYPLTLTQAGMLYHMQYNPTDIIYHNVYSWELKSRFDAEALSEVIREMVARHPILRTSFDLTRFSEPMQLVHSEAPLPLTAKDLRHLPRAEQDREIKALFEQEKNRPFAISSPPLLRLHVRRRSDKTFNFTLTEFHPIFDGWSVHTFVREMFECLFARLDGLTSPHSRSLRCGFRDYVHLERQALESKECQEFWERKLREATVLDLPRWPAPKSGGNRNCRIHYHLPERQFEGLKSVARSLALPLKSLLLTAHLKVLSLLSGQRDVSTGVVSGGRPEGPDSDRILGLFFNVVLLRQQLVPGTWAQLIRASFEHEREILPFRRYPLAKMQQTRSGKPLFEILFNYVHFHNMKDVFAGELEALDAFGELEETHVPFSVVFAQSPDGRRLRLGLRYDAEQFSDSQVRAVQGIFVRVLAAMAESPEGSHDQHAWLSPAEQHQAVVEGNDTRYRVPRGRWWHQRMTEWARRTPDAIAIVFENRRLSYGELDERSDRWASALRRRGVTGGAPVGLCLARAPEMVVAIHAVLKAGGAYLPLDTRFPRERLGIMLDESGTRLVLAGEEFADRFVDRDRTVLSLDELDGEALGCARLAPRALSGEELAYVLFTSGSSGRPKGVMIEHRQVANYLDAILERLTLGIGMSYAMVSGFSTDLANTVLLPALATGGCLHLLSEERVADAEAFARYGQRHAIDVLKIVPSHLKALLSSTRAHAQLPHRLLVVGGETCEWSLVQQVDRLARGCRVVNHYGPTETTVGVSTCHVNPQRSRWKGATVPIGRPLGNCQIHLLSADLQPSPLGVPGEVFVGGANLARGYLRQPGMTAARFLPDPFGQGGRLYATGDKARRLGDGQAEFLGRLDQQVKIHGFRIELREIEWALRRHPTVRDAVAAVVADATGENRIVSYAIAETTLAPVAELRSFLRRSLPEYMLPAAFVEIDAIPRMANGKLDLRALPVPESFSSWGAEYIAPRNDLERLLAEVWQDVLKIGRLSVEANFFDLGGHSLFMLRIHSKLREILEVELPMVTLFEYPTIASLARFLGQDQAFAASSRERANSQDRVSSQDPLERESKSRAASRRQALTRRRRARRTA